MGGICNSDKTGFSRNRERADLAQPGTTKRGPRNRRTVGRFFYFSRSREMSDDEKKIECREKTRVVGYRDRTGAHRISDTRTVLYADAEAVGIWECPISKVREPARRKRTSRRLRSREKSDRRKVESAKLVESCGTLGKTAGEPSDGAEKKVGPHPVSNTTRRTARDEWQKEQKKKS